MDLLFKTGTPENADKTTVGDSNFKEHFGQIDKNMAWDTIQPFIRQATRMYVVDWIGLAIYEKAATLYNTGTPADEPAEFIERLQDAIAYYTMYLAIPQLNLVTSDLGVGQHRDSDGRFDRTTQWAFKSAMWNLILQADQLLDKALQYADEQVEAEVEWFNEYADSTAWTSKYTYFRTTSSLQEYIDIRDSRRTYLSMVKYSSTAFDKYLLAVVGAEMHQEIVDEINDSDVSEANELLLPVIRKALAYYTLAESLPHMRVVLDGDGVKTVSSTDFYDASRVAPDEMVLDLRRKALDNAAMYRAELRNFLYDNVGDYPTWEDSDRYITDSTRSAVITSNDRTGGIML